MMAIKEFNAKGGVLGRTIEAIHMDTGTTPATGTRIAERMITRSEAAFLIGAVHSGVANAISQVAQKYGCVYLNANSSSPTEAGKDCHRVKFVWDGNGTNFSHAIVKNAMRVSGKNAGACKLETMARRRVTSSEVVEGLAGSSAAGRHFSAWGQA